MSDEKMVSVLADIRNWVRAASFASVRKLLETALPDEKSRMAYQMMDGTRTMEQVRVACKMSPNGVVALGQRCTSMGLMELKDDKKRVRLFDLNDFDLLEAGVQAAIAKPKQ